MKEFFLYGDQNSSYISLNESVSIHTYISIHKAQTTKMNL